ncbi:MASE1 domain-containing protein [Streptomyces sp. NPDC048208]|uniref:MASE1 domain-containing protein n=1 Tax=Streptomyces sp. NPDC048208 TaxID=3365515 RepID=UPI003711494C
MVGFPEARRPGGHVALALAVAVCYFAAGRLGLLCKLTVDGAVVTPIWPPTGVAVAALLVLGVRYWPGVTLGAYFIVLSLDTPVLYSLGYLVGNTLAPVVAVILMRRAGFRTDLGRLRDGLALVFPGALGAMLISSTLGVALLVVTDRMPAHTFWTVWLAWWVGDAMGVLLVTPLLLLLSHARGFLPTPRRWEAAALALVAACVIPPAVFSDFSLLFLVYPLIIWGALRFELVGSMLCALATSVLAALAANDGAGAFRGLSRVEIMAKLQGFNGTMALTALLLSAVITEQRHTRRSVEQACEELVEVLEHLTAGEAPPPRPAPEDADPLLRPGDDVRPPGRQGRP